MKDKQLTELGTLEEWRDELIRVINAITPETQGVMILISDYVPPEMEEKVPEGKAIAYVGVHGDARILAEMIVGMMNNYPHINEQVNNIRMERMLDLIGAGRELGAGELLKLKNRLVEMKKKFESPEPEAETPESSKQEEQKE